MVENKCPICNKILTIKEVKEKIREHEYSVYSAGYKLSGRSIEVKNVKILKRKVLADIILHDPEENSSSRIDRCEYPIWFFKGGADDKRLS